MTSILYPAEKECPDDPEHEMGLREGLQWWCHKCDKFYSLTQSEVRFFKVGITEGKRQLQAEIRQILGVK